MKFRSLNLQSRIPALISIFFLLLLSACSGGGGEGGSSSSEQTATQRTMASHWNHVAINASGFDHSAAGGKEQLGPTRSSRAMGIVHIAMFDAANAASGQKINPTY